MTILEGALSQLKTRATYTPDFSTLVENNKFLVLVYDRLRPQFNLDYKQYLSHTMYLGKAHTVEEAFVMKRTPMNGIAFPRPWQPMARSVRGDVFAVGLNDILRLDFHFKNNFDYERQIRYVLLEDQEAPTKNKQPVTVAAFIYLGISPSWESIEVGMPHCVARGGNHSNKLSYEWDPDQGRQFSA
jgi:hypothetical protein